MRIDSVVNQTYGDIEIIILDDCSTDNSSEIIEKYASKDNRIIKHYNTINTGSPFKQWKKGIDLAKGEFIWIAESDDYADITLIEKLLGAFFQNPDISLAYCQSNFVNTKGEVVGNHIENLSLLHPNLWQSDFCMDGNEVLAHFMPIINVIPNVGAVLFRRNMADKVNWDKLFCFRLGGDRYFWIEVLYNSKLCFTAEPLNYFRIEGDTQRAKHLHTALYLNEVAENVIAICKRVGLSRKVKHQVFRQWLHYFRKAKRYTNEGNLRFYYRSSFAFIRLLKSLL
jgi:glycosyltransferase involved in cell wall biosynthesis